MQAVLNIKLSEIDDRLLTVIEELLSKNVEIVIKKEVVELEEFDKNIPLDKVMQEFEKFGYDENFLSDLKVGFETSEFYAKHNENKVSEK